MRRRVNYWALTFIAIVLVAAGILVGRSYAPTHAAADATTTSTLAPVTFSSFYLVVGGSSSLGFEPTGIPHHRSRRTLDGYADDVVQIEGYKGIALSMTQVGCPGETVQTILNFKVADHCYILPETQMSRATSYLQANQSSNGLVSVDLGFNDIRPCLSPITLNISCVNKGIAAVKVDMPKVLKDLMSAAGPHVKFVGLEYYDPFLNHYFNGANGPSDATATLVAMNKMNAVLSQVYKSDGVAVANVPTYFQMNDSTRVTLGNVGMIPQNVVSACNLTWMCQPAPYGPDDHPTDEGYLQIANAITAVIPKSW